MSEGGRTDRGIEILLLVLIVGGAAFAWFSRGNMPPAGRPAAAAAPATIDSSGWTAHASRPHHRIDLPAEALERAEKLCATMAESQIGYALHDSVTAEITDRYEVGDLETGAGDSIIMEGIARRSAGRLGDFRCSMTNLGAYAGSPSVTHRERE